MTLPRMARGEPPTTGGLTNLVFRSEVRVGTCLPSGNTFFMLASDSIYNLSKDLIECSGYPGDLDQEASKWNGSLDHVKVTDLCHILSSKQVIMIIVNSNTIV